MVSDFNKHFGGSTDLAKKRHGSVDLHTPILPPLVLTSLLFLCCRIVSEVLAHNSVPGAVCSLVCGGADIG